MTLLAEELTLGWFGLPDLFGGGFLVDVGPYMGLTLAFVSPFYINDVWINPLIPKHRFHDLLPLSKEIQDTLILRFLFNVYNPEERKQLAKMEALWAELVASLRALDI